MSRPALVFTHIHKCAGTSLREMLFALLRDQVPPANMHIPGCTCAIGNDLPVLAERGLPLPGGIRVLADHTPFGAFDSRLDASGGVFRVTLLREPFGRFLSWYGFCLERGVVLDRKHAADPGSTDAMVRLVRYFTAHSGYEAWFDPAGRNPARALDNLLGYDVIARHDDLGRFCPLFNRRNPFGVAFREGDILHANRSAQTCELTGEQADIAREELEADYRIWNDPAVRDATGR